MFIEKEKRILTRLRETDYTLFNHDKYDALNYVKSCLLTIAHYRTTSVKSEIAVKTNKGSKQIIETVLENKNKALIDATKCIKSLNKLCKQLDIEPFIMIDTKDTASVENAIGKFADELFQNGIARR